MKNFKLILNLMLIATSFMFFQCTSDYTPVAGPPGDNGVDGICCRPGKCRSEFNDLLGGLFDGFHDDGWLLRRASP